MGTKFIVVTNCTARKRVGVPLVPFAPKGECIEQVVQGWQSTLATQSIRLQAENLYVGRAIQEAKIVAKKIDAKLFIVSAGIGLVGAGQSIPGYDISASGNATELTATLTRFGASKSDWWHLLTSGKGLSWLLSQNPDSSVLLSLPSEYLDMILGDLKVVSPKELSRVCVFTSIAGQKKIVSIPGLSVIPYDERLESIEGYAGTRSDFPQRALKHFVNELQGHLMPVEQAISAVVKLLSNKEKKVIPDRKRLDDLEIQGLIRQAWESVDGNSARLLRHLRDIELVACEQGRFSRLRREVEAHMKEFGAK